MKRKYWYHFLEYYCPVCGSSSVNPKERKYTKKPKEYHERHEIIWSYDYCNSLGEYQ